ncbi:zinc finger CCCH domain-containing protein 3 [Rhynchophorus ferrugineus]|uniref:zinc finger CCCH domain-containing protein 3 n=1 Tax=Rhynchophorus ferrugineus TaxID=354439 RepID=UPI003FCED8BE
MNPHTSNIYMFSHYSEREYTNMTSANNESLNLKQNKVFVNPNFRKNIHVNKIHINPNRRLVGDTYLQNHGVIYNSSQNVNIQTDHSQGIKIHINPHKKNFVVPQNIHINPRFKALGEFQKKIDPPILEKKPAIILTKTKLVRVQPHTSIPTTTITKHQPRRSSVRSKFKIVRNNNCQTPVKVLRDKITRFKVDHRTIKSFSSDNKRYKIVNKKLKRSNEACQVVKKVKSPVKRVQSSLCLVNINGIMYKKTKNSLRKMSICKMNIKKSPNIVLTSKYKIIKKVQGKKTEKVVKEKYGNIIKKFKIIRVHTPLKPVVTPRKKLKICNIPCPFYRKYGVCRGKNNGKCVRKHDPAQIALCTRFLQGDCFKEKCLLSHQVSSEKMPTCKFYLEGSCVKDNCPYLHVKLSKNAEICRDFLEGFCKEAAECKRRHQYLCPDYEKYGNCPKQRCPYPHGKMVRSFLIHKTKFTKNYSKKKKSKNTENFLQNKEINSDTNAEKQRYYEKHNSQEPSTQPKNNDSENESIGLHLRPKLGNLPSFIPFKE